MAFMIDEKTKKELTGTLERLKQPVQILYFTQQFACPACRDQEELLKEVAGHSKKLKVEVYDFLKDATRAAEYGIDKIPATVVRGDKDYGIRFYGLTAGYEFSTFIQAVLMISEGKSGLPKGFETLVASINEPVHIQVMTTLTCPYCPQAVHVAHQMAFINNNIRADMVDAAEFPALSQRYEVGGVPKTIINEVHSFEGALPMEAFYLQVLKAINPEEYRRIEDMIRESRGERKVKKGEAGHTYEVIIVGGGPAAMSSALYAARKDLDVLLVAKSIGGQISYTAVVDNYLGLPGIGGNEMVERFRIHMEQYPIAEVLGQNVALVEKKDSLFRVVTEDEQHFTGHSIIYCAGKEYRRLGVPGEERFIGKGIAFCATCDAPLYREKRVAVVGGGNSAFTAIRDLIHFASEIHLVHRRDDFTADSALVSEVKKAPNLKIHTSTVVREVIGKETLEGMRLMSSDGKDFYDVLVDGVFYEIGLNPITGAVKKLVRLNENEEIPVGKDNATDVPGFFAAGDATDVQEKQISISVGDGAKAALAAHKYLLDQKLTRSLVKAGSEWL
jgi:glutaredoxin-like protein